MQIKPTTRRTPTSNRLIAISGSLLLKAARTIA